MVRQAHHSRKLEYQFRPMRMEDLDTIMAIEQHIYPYPWTRGNFKDALNSGYSAWLLMHNEAIIGYSLMMLVLDEAHLLNLSIAKAYQKQGLGRYLLEYMVEIAKNNQMANMFLEVRPSNLSAIALYENMGFNEMAIRRGYYPAANGREDAVLMGLAL
ncbi:MAG: ribosomal protein S18-alanine N-acetyltransferase [Methylotenera sp.]|uniref:ribosomal protein S18-alanine N-acetyltransferase n=1 Tax=Methylotenera sp. TaxID=2051956 RepID=UPI0025E44EDE|nr:ribosomal protein S18-alanine N-acetyltransferase [Methylotenera sp.]